MALSTILLRRSSTCLIDGGRQFYCRYLSTAAAKRSNIIIPTAISSVRQFSANSNESSVRENIQQPASNEPTVRDILTQIQSMQEEIEFLRNEREGKSEELPEAEEVVVVKEKHPLLKQIELEMWKSWEDLYLEAEKLQLPHGFEVERDTPGAATVTLRGWHKNEIIKIELSIPAYHVMQLTVKVGFSGFSGFFSSTKAEFHCTLTGNGFEVHKIKEPTGTESGILFYHLPQNLKDEFLKYLEVRGVDASSASILYRYMIGRLKRENLKGLENFKTMVAKE